LHHTDAQAEAADKQRKASAEKAKMVEEKKI
jgi:hypothetical protein